MPVYPVDPTPKFISGRNSASYILKNSGAQTVYIGQDSSLTVASRAFSLTPGSVMQWPGNSSEIWAMTGPGVSSEIEILYDSEASYTPGPDRVTAEIDGTVDVNVADEVIVVQNNDLIELAALSSPFSNTIFPLVQQNMRDYASVRLQAGGFSTPVANDFDVVLIRVQWLNSAFNVIFTDESVAFMGTRTTWVFPVKAPYMTVQLVGYDAAGALTAIQLDQVRIWGSYHILQESYFSQNRSEMIMLPTVTNDTWVGSSNLKMAAFQFTQAPGTNRMKLPSIMGETQALITWSIGTANTNTRAVLTAHTPSAYGFGAQSLDVARITNPTILQTYEMPSRMNGRIPLSILFANASAGDYRINMSLAYTGPQT